MARGRALQEVSCRFPENFLVALRDSGERSFGTLPTVSCRVGRNRGRLYFPVSAKTLASGNKASAKAVLRGLQHMHFFSRAPRGISLERTKQTMDRMAILRSCPSTPSEIEFSQ